MRNIYLFILLALLLSCGEERVLQLPKVEQTNVQEVLDVSPIYIFYDETMPDSTYFDRSKLISTTNWLVNVDKRLTMKQVLPHLQYLQKKRNKASIHKNEKAKNFFTCNDSSIENLGFLEFTNVEFCIDKLPKEYSNDQIDNTISNLTLSLFSQGYVSVDEFYNGEHMLYDTVQYDSVFSPNKKIWKYVKKRKIQLLIDKKVKFQNYITFKSHLLKRVSDSTLIDFYEVFY